MMQPIQVIQADQQSAPTMQLFNSVLQSARQTAQSLQSQNQFRAQALQQVNAQLQQRIGNIELQSERLRGQKLLQDERIDAQNKRIEKQFQYQKQLISERPDPPQSSNIKTPEELAQWEYMEQYKHNLRQEDKPDPAGSKITETERQRIISNITPYFTVLGSTEDGKIISIPRKYYSGPSRSYSTKEDVFSDEQLSRITNLQDRIMVEQPGVLNGLANDYKSIQEQVLQIADNFYKENDVLRFMRETGVKPPSYSVLTSPENEIDPNKPLTLEEYTGLINAAKKDPDGYGRALVDNQYTFSPPVFTTDIANNLSKAWAYLTEYSNIEKDDTIKELLNKRTELSFITDITNREELANSVYQSVYLLSRMEGDAFDPNLPIENYFNVDNGILTLKRMDSAQVKEIQKQVQNLRNNN